MLLMMASASLDLTLVKLLNYRAELPNNFGMFVRDVGDVGDVGVGDDGLLGARREGL